MQNHPISAWAENDRPREKLLNSGKHTLTDSELIAILLRTGSGHDTAVDLARKLMISAGNNLSALSKMTPAEISRLKGIGITKAITLLAAFELGNRKSVEISEPVTKVSSSRDAYNMLRPVLSDLRHEEFWLLLLDRANKVIKKLQLSKGGVAGTVVDPKLVFKLAVDHLASGIIMFHNHPSGNLKPSDSDLKLTKRLKSSGELLEIAVLDHIIITNTGFFSFVDEGVM
jgi:DNA repair protein RadC